MDQNEASAIDGFFSKLEQAARSAPPRDSEAEARITQWMERIPGAAYFLTQTAIVTAHALEAAQHRVQELEAQLAGSAQHKSGGFLSGLFGGGSPAPQAAASGAAVGAGYAPPGGPWGAGGGGLFGGGSGGSGGGGFLSGAAQTAAGVAGGMLAANAIENLFSGHERAGLFGGGAEGLLGGGASQEPVDLHYSADDRSSALDGDTSSDGSDDGMFDNGGGSDDGGF